MAKMENIDKRSLEYLTKRVELLENKMQILGNLMLQISKAVAEEGCAAVESSTKKAVEQELVNKGSLNLNVSEKQDNPDNRKNGTDSSFPGSNVLMGTADTDAEIDNEDIYTKICNRFIEKYTAGTGEFDLYLDIAKDLIIDLNRYLDWNQVSDEIKSMLYLEKAYDSKVYYADCEQIDEEYVYFVAPAEPSMKYTQRDFLRLALPQFYEISYSFDLEGKLLKLIRPAVFLQDDEERYVLKVKGKIVLTR